MLGVDPLPLGIAFLAIDEIQDHIAVAEAQGGLHTVGESTPRFFVDGQSVDNDFDGVPLLLLELGDFV